MSERTGRSRVWRGVMGWVVAAGLACGLIAPAGALWGEDVLDVRGPIVGVGDPRDPYGDVPYPVVLAEMDLQGEPQPPVEPGGPFIVNYRNGLIGMSATFIALPPDPRAGGSNRSRGRSDASRSLVRAAEQGLKEQQKAGDLEDLERLAEWSGFVGPVGEPIPAYFGLYSYRALGEARRLVVVGVSRQTGRTTLRLSYPVSETEQAERRASEVMLDWGYLLMRGRPQETERRRRG